MNMYKIDNIKYNYYYSNKIPKQLFEHLLKNSECNTEGQLELMLKSGHQFTHFGPYIIPSVRWIDSFENDAEFNVLCDVVKI